MSQHRFRALLVFVAMNGLVGNVVGPFLPLYFQELGLSGLQSGVYFVPFLKQAFGLSVLGASLYAGTGLLFVGAGTWLGAVLLRRGAVKDVQTLMCVPNLWASFTFRCLHEIGDGFVLLAYYQGIARVFRVEKIGGCAAFVSLWTAVGSLIGALVFGWLGGRYGHQWPLMVSGLILALVPQMLRLGDAGLEGEYGRA